MIYFYVTLKAAEILTAALGLRQSFFGKILKEARPAILRFNERGQTCNFEIYTKMQ